MIVRSPFRQLVRPSVESPDACFARTLTLGELLVMLVGDPLHLHEFPLVDHSINDSRPQVTMTGSTPDTTPRFLAHFTSGYYLSL